MLESIRNPAIERRDLPPREQPHHRELDRDGAVVAFHDEVLIPTNLARGTVTFYLCRPDQVTKAGCPTGKGTKIGSATKIIGDHRVPSDTVKGKETKTTGTPDSAAARAWSRNSEATSPLSRSWAILRVNV